MSIFSESNYRSIILLKINENKGLKAYRGQLAKIAGCQQSFLSQVLNGDSHNLSLEHGANLCSHWNFTELESEWFMELIMLERSQGRALKQIHRRRLKKIKSEQSNLSSRYKIDALDTKKIANFYYSDWLVGAVHVICSVEGFNSARSLAARFNVEQDRVSRALDFLVDAELIENSEGRWRVTRKKVHVGQQSPHYIQNNMNWKYRAIHSLQNPALDPLHYSSTVSISLVDFERVREILLETIDSVTGVVDRSGEEDAFSILIDWFRV